MTRRSADSKPFWKSLKVLPSSETISTYRTETWRAALLPEIDYRYRLLKGQGLAESCQCHSIKYLSRLSLLSNSPQKTSKLTNHRSTVCTQPQENNTWRMPQGSWASLAQQSQVEHKKQQSQLSTGIGENSDIKKLLEDNYNAQKLEYLSQEVQYLRTTFLRHYERHHSELTGIIQEQAPQGLDEQQRQPASNTAVQ